MKKGKYREAYEGIYNNGEYGKSNETIIVPIMLLWPVFQGKMPKPENFSESRT